MRRFGGSLIFLVILVLVNLYVFQALKSVGTNWQPRTRFIVYGIYWLLCGFSFLFFLSMPALQNDTLPRAVRTYFFAIAIGFFLAQIVSLPFFLIDDLRRLFQWIIAQFVARSTDADPGNETKEAISRSAFLSWAGLGLGSVLFGTLLIGFRNKYNYRIRKHRMQFSHLPAAFRGFTIAHISDIHSGSFMNKEAVQRGVEMINALNADVILFTGDLVNDRAEEMLPYMDVFDKLQAKHGVYSTLGNHDYGDYARWENETAKQANLQQLRNIHKQLGWNLLDDMSVTLSEQGESIALLGVQNISGKGRFHSYGSLPKAYADTAAVPFKILMSHDPSHWDSEVRKQFPDIALMLSGHTHGMQFGVEIPGVKWSPVQWMYKQWAGLYEAGNQKLYVNRGFGFIGYPGRVGILPEITHITLV